jgi:hypothetical protein
MTMPPKKKQPAKQSSKKAAAVTKSAAPTYGVAPVSADQSPVSLSEELDARIARVDELIQASETGALTGRVPEIRSEHSCQWGRLIEEDIALRRQILTLKQKENALLGLIRDRVAENVIETADEATQQGVLKQPEA